MANKEQGQSIRGGIALFKVAGIQVSLDFSWFVIFILVLWSLSAGYFPRQLPAQTTQTYWLAGSVATLLFFFSVLFHELSHAFMALHFGIRITEIKLFIFGGMARLSEDAKTPGKEFKIAVVGPVSSFFLAVLFWLVKGLGVFLGYPMAATVFGYLTWINVALGVFNLLPGFPLDGGRMLRAALWQKTGSLPRATKWASDIGKGLAVALMVLGGFEIFSGILIGGLWLIFIGMFLRGVAEGGYQEVMVRQSLDGVRVREVMIDDVVTVPPETPLSDMVTHYFLKYGYKGFPVERAGVVLGVFSLQEMKGIPEQRHQFTTVEEVMQPLDESLTISSDSSLVEAMQKMSREGVGRLLVMEGGEMIGMITKTGLIRFLEIKKILDV